MKGAEKEARRWFLQAEDDLRFVEWISKEGRFFDKGCFISQQAGEKALKACLYGRGERRVIGHSLFEMVHDISNTEKTFGTIIDEARRHEAIRLPMPVHYWITPSDFPIRPPVPPPGVSIGSPHSRAVCFRTC